MEKITLLYGTGNVGKLAIMREYLRSIREVELIGLQDLTYAWKEPEESGKNPLDNARQKALGYYRICRRPVFSADSGLYIEGLTPEEQPGVHVRRIAGHSMTDEEMREYYKNIARRFGGKCIAQYQNAICLVFSEEEIYYSDAPELSWERFYLTTDERPQKYAGFPLDAISTDLKGRHCYDSDSVGAVEEDGSGFVRFFREALARHRQVHKEQKNGPIRLD